MKRMILVALVSLVVTAQGKLIPAQIMPASWSASLQYGKRYAELLIGASDAKSSEVSLAKASERLGHPCPYSPSVAVEYHYVVSAPTAPVAVTAFKVNQKFVPPHIQFQYDLKKADDQLKEMERYQLLQTKELEQVHLMIQKKISKMRVVVPNPA
jgi:hypothetical protein